MNILALVKIVGFSWCCGDGNKAAIYPNINFQPHRKKEAGGYIFLLGDK